jgi:hypothetical protein
MALAGGDYEIRIKRRLSDSLLAAFEGLTTTWSRWRRCCMARSRTRRRSTACWTGSNLGLELVEIRQLPASADEVPAEPDRQPPAPWPGALRRSGRLQTDLACSPLGASSMQTDPDGPCRIVWMINRMVKCFRHPSRSSSCRVVSQPGIQHAVVPVPTGKG